MSATYLIICLIISIALVVLFCTKVKMNPAIALILGSLLLGVLTKVPLNDITAADGTVTNGLITVINNGFGNMMGSIGFPIGLGIILGQFVSDTGGATVIADKLVSLFPEKYAMYAVGFAGFNPVNPGIFRCYIRYPHSNWCSSYEKAQQRNWIHCRGNFYWCWYCTYSGASYSQPSGCTGVLRL